MFQLYCKLISEETRRVLEQFLVFLYCVHGYLPELWIQGYMGGVRRLLEQFLGCMRKKRFTVLGTSDLYS